MNKSGRDNNRQGASLKLVFKQQGFFEKYIGSSVAPIIGLAIGIWHIGCLSDLAYRYSVFVYAL